MNGQILINTADVETKEGTVVVSMRIDEKTYYPSGELILSQVFDIEPESLKVNAAIDRDIFTIDTDRAPRGVIDEETDTWIRPRAGLAASRDASSRWRIVLWISSFAMVALLAAFTLRRRRGK
jgi:hypothetical protein